MQAVKFKNIQEMFEYLNDNKIDYGSIFYEKLKVIDPSFKAIFEDDSVVKSKKLMKAVNFIIKNLDYPDGILPILIKVACKIPSYIVNENYERAVEEAFKQTFEMSLGSNFHEDIKKEWTSMFKSLADVTKKSISSNGCELSIIKSKNKILAVDDEVFNLDIICDYLETEGYEVIRAEDGLKALEQLKIHPDIDAIVLDRMMPKMNGMQFLEITKNNPDYKYLPVIMQTAAASSEQILQGIEAGVFYYLTKPYEEQMLISIVASAVSDAKNRQQMKEEVRRQKKLLGLMNKGSFTFRTLMDAKNLSYHLSSCFPNPEKVVYGLHELLVNAVEHGNLGITFEDQTKLLNDHNWNKEVEKRLYLPEYSSKSVTTEFENDGTKITVRIKDQGNGFNWQDYLEIKPERATLSHGRGIVTSKCLSFDNIEYVGCGNEVVCTVLL